MNDNMMLLMSKTQDISFSNSEVVFTVLSGVFMALVGIIAFLIMRKCIKLNIKAAVIGAVVWFVFAIVLKEILLSPVLIFDDPVSRAVKGNIWLYYLVGALAAGLFEETGRLVAFRTVMKKNTDKQDSLSYGVGHGGFEALYLGFQIGSLGIVEYMINKSGIESIVKGAPQETVDTLLAQLEQLGSKTLGHSFLMGYERIPAVVSHVFFSVLVFAAVRDRKIWLYFLAMFLHFVIDFSLVFFYAGYIDLTVSEIILSIMTAVMAVLTFKLLYKKMDRDTSLQKEDMNGISRNIQGAL